MRIAVLTSGGDAPGMNACVRAVVRCALAQGAEVLGIRRGYQGIYEDDIFEMDRRSVSNIVQTGGTILQTARCEEFTTKEGVLKAAAVLDRHKIDGLVVIGGDGSFHGAADLAALSDLRVVGVPGTIDNDLAYTDATIGFDTAVNNVLWAINALRDTMQSHNKVTFVEVMGRHCGDIALHAGISGGAEYILVPEIPFDIRQIARSISENDRLGKKSNLVVLAEGAGRMEDICAEFEAECGIKPRQTRLGYIQRGGSPTHRDRLLACRLGCEAVKLLLAGEGSCVVGVRGDGVIHLPITEALAMKKTLDQNLWDMVSSLT